MSAARNLAFLVVIFGVNAELIPNLTIVPIPKKQVNL